MTNSENVQGSTEELYANCLQGYPPVSPLGPDKKQRWLQALRSGRFSQAQGHLCVDNGEDYSFCCLGVLAVTEGKDPEILQGQCILDDVGLRRLLRPNDWMWGKCVTAEGDTHHISLQQLLASKNDSGKSFEQIADWIEANL